MRRLAMLFGIIAVMGCAGPQMRPEPGDFSINDGTGSYLLIVKPSQKIIWPKGEKVGLSAILSSYQQLQKDCAAKAATVAKGATPSKAQPKVKTK